MDCLLTVLIIFSYICVTEQAVGYVEHSVAGKKIHCIPVVCQSGSQLSFCKETGTKDYCHKCPIGCIQNQKVDSRTVVYSRDIPKCVPGPYYCPPEAKLSSHEANPPVCECDITRGYAGVDAMFCVKKAECPPGLELKRDGRCSTCPPGKYKPTVGYGPCQPFTNCEEEKGETLSPGNTTADVVCGKFSTTMSKIYITTVSSSTPSVLQDDDLLRGQTNDKQTILQIPEEIPNRLVFVVISFQTTLMLLLVYIIIVIVRMKRMVRDISSRQRKDFSEDEKCALESDKDITYIPHKIRTESVPLCQPESIYPEINDKPCTPTAPDPSIPYNYNM